MTFTEDAVLSYLQDHLPQYLDDLRALVQIDSGSDDPEGINAVNDWLEERLTSLGLRVERFSNPGAGDDLLATWHGQGRGRILLLGHSDTVYPRGTAAQRPMTIVEDHILGPGTCDMKAGLLTGIYALAALRHSGFCDFETIAFLCVSDEETEQRHSLNLIAAQSRQADVALTLEAARENGDIVTARKAVRWYTVEAFGQAAHAGVEPEKGCNAILALGHHMVALERLNDLARGTTINVGVIEGGRLPNVVPDYARMRLDLRAFTQQEMDALDTALHQQLARETVAGVRVVATLEEGATFPPLERTLAVVELEQLAMAAARSLGFTVKGARTGGASDASYVAAVGTPVLDGLGPIGGLDHSPREYIVLSSIVPRTALLARLIQAVIERANHPPADSVIFHRRFEE